MAKNPSYRPRQNEVCASYDEVIRDLRARRDYYSCLIEALERLEAERKQDDTGNDDTGNTTTLPLEYQAFPAMGLAGVSGDAKA